MGDFRGSKIQNMGQLSNGWTDWHQIWFTSADSSGNGHRLNIIRPSIPQGHFGGFMGSNIKKSGEAVKGWTDWHKNLVHIMQMNLKMDTG